VEQSVHLSLAERLSRVALPTRTQQWLREPLLHFLVFGFALFVVSGAFNPQTGQRYQADRIELTEDDLRQVIVAWTAQWQRPPTPEEMRGLLENKIHEEILYREALALGLDKGDTIVKRRLAQKMDFLSEDVSGLREPPVEELRAWYAKNSERFILPGRISFRHIYFSVDQRGQRARDVAVQALQKLNGAAADSPLAARAGDPFMFQDYYADRSPEQIANVFGSKFAQALFQLKSGAWSGPVESGLGWHLVLIESVTPGRVPAFEEVEEDVKAQWIADQRDTAKRKAFEAMRARYEIVLPKAQAKEAAGAPEAQREKPK
jgi:peptidyl-prolyl cis-trans isomerase C